MVASVEAVVRDGRMNIPGATDEVMDRFYPSAPTIRPLGSPREEAERIFEEGIWNPLRIPVDPYRIAAKMDIQVHEIDALPDDTVSALVKKPGHDPKILIKSSMWLSSKRLLCALHIGHYVQEAYSEMQSRQRANKYIHTRRKGQQLDWQEENKDDRDRFAEEFAAWLLIPEAALQIKLEESNGQYNPVAIKSAFKVPSDLVVYRYYLLSGDTQEPKAEADESIREIA